MYKPGTATILGCSQNWNCREREKKSEEREKMKNVLKLNVYFIIDLPKFAKNHQQRPAGRAIAESIFSHWSHTGNFVESTWSQYFGPDKVTFFCSGIWRADGPMHCESRHSLPYSMVHTESTEGTLKPKENQSHTMLRCVPVCAIIFSIVDIAHNSAVVP